MSEKTGLRLFRTTIECDVWVIAPTREAAEKILSARDARDILNDDIRHNASVMARETTEANDDSLPWHAVGAEDAKDATVTEWARVTKALRELDKQKKLDAEAQPSLPIE